MRFVGLYLGHSLKRIACQYQRISNTPSTFFSVLSKMAYDITRLYIP